MAGRTRGNVVKKTASIFTVAVMVIILLSGCGNWEKDEQLNRYTVQNGMYAIYLPGEWTEEDNRDVSGALNLHREDGADVMVFGVPKGMSLSVYTADINDLNDLLDYADTMLLQGPFLETVLSDDTPVLSDVFSDVIAKEGIMILSGGVSGKIFIQFSETEKAFYIFMLTVSKIDEDFRIYEKIVPSLKEQMLFEELDVPVSEELSDTLRWFNACYSPIISQNGGNVNIVAGFEPNDFNKGIIAGGLNKSWGVTDRQSLEKQILRLMSGGHNQGALDDLKNCGADKMNRDDLIVAMETESLTEEDKISLLAAFDAWNDYGEQAIAAWDMSRAMQLIGWGYVAGYYTYEEAMDKSMETALLIQQTFDSWEDFFSSYLYGYSYWCGEDSADKSSSAYTRRQIYEKLKKEGVYDVDWNITFIKDW